jgi:hypothetical protein
MRPRKAAEKNAFKEVLGLPFKWIKGKVWKSIAAKEAQAQPKGNPSTVSEVLALQANLCEEAQNHWAKAIVDYMKENELEGAGDQPKVDCGLASGEDLQALEARETRQSRGRRINPETEKDVAAINAALSGYKRVSSGSLADIRGEEVEPLSSFVAKKPVGPPPQPETVAASAEPAGVGDELYGPHFHEILHG